MLFSMLANLAEDRQGKLNESGSDIATVLQQLTEQGISVERAAALLDKALIVPVLTALCLAVPVGLAAAVVIGVAACTTTNPYTREQQTSKVVKGAGIGAAAELLHLFDVPRELLPRVAASAEVHGETRGVPGLPDGIPIAGIAGDPYVRAVGVVKAEPAGHPGHGDGRSASGIRLRCDEPELGSRIGPGSGDAEVQGHVGRAARRRDGKSQAVHLGSPGPVGIRYTDGIRTSRRTQATGALRGKPRPCHRSVLFERSGNIPDPAD